MRQPLVSVIVPTKNNHETLDACLRSIRQQSYRSIELIVVDNNSTDDTKEIASDYTNLVFNQGPERSAQRNFGVRRASGEYVLAIDSDMVLTEGVIQACVTKVRDDDIKAVIIPEESFGQGFWAQCKRLERSFYVGIDTIEAPRFFEKKLYEKIGGYNEQMTGAEDWDIGRRVRELAGVGRINAFIHHDEGRPGFLRTARKMYYYGQHAAAYFAENPTNSALTDKSGPLERYKLFLSHPVKLLRNPVIGIGMITLKTAEYFSAGLGYLQHRRTATRGDSYAK